MFNMGWTELLVIGVVALIVIGPQDLPEMFRQLGRFTGKIRSMGREFQRAMDQAAKESGVKDVAKDLKTATSPKALGLDAVKGAADRFEKWDPLKQAKPAAKPVAEKKTASADAAYTDAAPPVHSFRRVLFPIFLDSSYVLMEVAFFISFCFILALLIS